MRVCGAAVRLADRTEYSAEGLLDVWGEGPAALLYLAQQAYRYGGQVGGLLLREPGVLRAKMTASPAWPGCPPGGVRQRQDAPIV